MTLSDLQIHLKDTYIKNDYGELRALYILLCLKAGLHDTYPPEAYKWPWVYSSPTLVQHAFERKYIRGKQELTLGYLTELYRQIQ